MPKPHLDDLSGPPVTDALSHLKRHQWLHGLLDELVADYLTHLAPRTSLACGSIDDSIYNLMKWSAEQAVEPDHDHA